VFRFADLELDTRTEIARRGTREIPLSPTESKLLEHFLRHPRRVLTRDEILDAVWGGDFPRPTNVVDVYVGYLRTALEAEGETRLIQTIRGAGYALRSPTPPREPRGEAWNAYA
jgi:two-component system response regulator MprA